MHQRVKYYFLETRRLHQLVVMATGKSKRAKVNLDLKNITQELAIKLYKSKRNDDDNKKRVLSRVM